jgi:iron complex outermembrane receptor protein
LPATAAEGDTQAKAQGFALEEVYVTARRKEERLQDVPISMSVFSQQQLDNANIVPMLAIWRTIVPSLQINTADSAAIRQPSRYADFPRNCAPLRRWVCISRKWSRRVAPTARIRGMARARVIIFDLQNVQVLKGPQGTLFGRNSTGGAILITPQRPTEELGGLSLKASAGNYDMWRTQGVFNTPAGDRVRLRFGIDHQERDGYLDNWSGIGPRPFWRIWITPPFRGSAVIDITDTIENYTIMSATRHSDNNGYPGSLIDCKATGALGDHFLQRRSRESRKAAGNDGFYDVYSFVPDPVSEQELGAAH